MDIGFEEAGVVELEVAIGDREDCAGVRAAARGPRLRRIQRWLRMRTTTLAHAALASHLGPTGRRGGVRPVKDASLLTSRAPLMAATSSIKRNMNCDGVKRECAACTPTSTSELRMYRVVTCP